MRDVREADSTRPNEIVSEQRLFKVPLKGRQIKFMIIDNKRK